VSWLADPLAPGDAVWCSALPAPGCYPAGLRRARERTITLDLAQPVRAITPGSRASCTTRMAACWAAAHRLTFAPGTPSSFASPPADGAPRHGPIGRGGVRSSLESARLAPDRRCPMTTCSRWPHARCALAPCGARLARLPLAATTPSRRRNRPTPLATAATSRRWHELRFPAVRELTFATTYVPTAASPAGGSATPAARRPTDARNRRALSPTESRLAATALRAALVPSGGIARVDLPARGGFGNDVYLERNDASV